MDPLLSLQEVDAFYGRVQALRGTALDVFPGEVVALLGANGAGKSTVLRLISGLLTPARGQVLLRGKSIGGMPTNRIVEAGVGHVPEGRQLFPEMSVDDNLFLGCFRSRRLAAERRERVIELFPVLKQRLKQAAGTLSGGEQQMVTIGRTLMGSPSLLMLDEPSMGLAPIVVERLLTAIRQLNQEGLTILLVEQNAALALGIAHRAYVLELGHVVAAGTNQEVRSSPSLLRAYLGERAESWSSAR